MNILCYGDSNTWGYVPNINGYSSKTKMEQYDEKDCWWFGLKTANNNLFVDGLCGRCVAHENRWLKGRNAMSTIKNDLALCPNLDLVIVQLGVNDCKVEYHDSAEQIANNLRLLLKKIEDVANAKILLVGPPIVLENNKTTQKYYVGAQTKTKELNVLYEQLAEEKKYLFVSGLDLQVGEDGEHLTKLAHRQLRKKVEEAIKSACC